MPDEYSIYDAKAQLSALVRRVREGSSFIITVHGEPVAELRPITPPEKKPQTLEERIAELEARGEITPAVGHPSEFLDLPFGDAAPGALQRFLEDRE
ncbi:MAG: type II toxin-antitoxin system prevent-host-death family antitoxin [Gemmatimonadaceae bacterium]|nr:type II toxin-antitoxin system prevent-host-death family antitoxin [Gemmatimonadaceae bacterium]